MPATGRGPVGPRTCCGAGTWMSRCSRPRAVASCSAAWATSRTTQACSPTSRPTTSISRASTPWPSSPRSRPPCAGSPGGRVGWCSTLMIRSSPQSPAEPTRGSRCSRCDPGARWWPGIASPAGERTCSEATTSSSAKARASRVCCRSPTCRSRSAGWLATTSPMRWLPQPGRAPWARPPSRSRRGCATSGRRPTCRRVGSTCSASADGRSSSISPTTRQAQPRSWTRPRRSRAAPPDGRRR